MKLGASPELLLVPGVLGSRKDDGVFIWHLLQDFTAFYLSILTLIPGVHYVTGENLARYMLSASVSPFWLLTA